MRLSYCGFVCTWIGLVVAAPAHGAALIRISEWPHVGDELVDLTQVGAPPQDGTRWSVGDATEVRGPGSASTLAPHMSARIGERSGELFRAAWDLSVNLAILAENAQNPGRAGEIDRYDASTALAERVTHGDTAGVSATDP